MSGSAQNAELDLYDYSAYEGRPKIEWPNGARLAFWVAPNIEFYELDPPTNPYPQTLAASIPPGARLQHP